MVQDGKHAAEDDVLPDGNIVNKGDGVSYMTYAMGRMTYNWGKDAEEFLPGRWLCDGVFRSESPFKFTALHVSHIFMFHFKSTFLFFKFFYPC